MKYRPALFNTPMVCAIEEGRKNTTRRLVRLPGKDWEILAAEKRPGADATGTWELTIHGTIGGLTEDFIIHEDAPCLPGDILWVRETWMPVKWAKPEGNAIPDDWQESGFLYYAKDELRNSTGEPIRWRPSIHMPKEAARIFLRVKNVRLGRLQDSFDDIVSSVENYRNEGIDIGETCENCIECYGEPMCRAYVDEDGMMTGECHELDSPRSDFSDLWDSTVKKADLHRHGWAANPWVWVIEFERIPKPDDWNKRSEQK